MSKEYKRLSQLSWILLSCKFLYYCGAKYNIPSSNTISDVAYDKLEDEYKGLAKKLGIQPSVTDMVGFQESATGAKAMIKEHLIATKGKIPHLANIGKETSKKDNQALNVRSQALAYLKTTNKVFIAAKLKDKTRRILIARIKKALIL